MVTYNKLHKIEPNKVVLLQSGGLDSCYLACLFNRLKWEVHHLFVDYGQNSHKQELKYALKIVEKYGGKLHKAKLEMPWLKQSCSLTNGADVKDTYKGDKQMGTIKGNTYVPMRNHVLLSMASSLAESLDIQYIGIAVEGSQDFFGRPKAAAPDKHENFLVSIEKSINEGSATKHTKHKKIEIIAPILGNTKEQTILQGDYIGCDFSLSWSCYNSGDTPCGYCPACVDRKIHFENVNISDPLLQKVDVK